MNNNLSVNALRKKCIDKVSIHKMRKKHKWNNKGKMSTTTENKPVITSQKEEVRISKDGKGTFGSGRYSPAMEELFRDSQRLLGFSDEQAFVVARQIGVDAGNLNKGSVRIKYGKTVNKAGQMTLKEVTENMKLTSSPAMNIGSVCSQLDAIRKIGLVVKDCTMSDNIMIWVNDKASNIEASE